MCVAPISVPDKCLTPYGIKGQSMVVPCGHCVECAKRKRNDWFVRIWTTYQEYRRKHLPVWFVTITIDPKLWPNLNVKNPDVSTRVSPFIRSWNERLRYLNGGKMPLRFLCSEFGHDGKVYKTKDGRTRVAIGALHFHGVLFGKLDVSRISHGLKQTHGTTDFDLIRGPRGIRYVVKYATKDYSIADPRLRARVFCSPGIGDPSFYFGDDLPTRFVLVNGFHYATPRYFLEKQYKRFYGSAYKDQFGVPRIVIENRKRHLLSYFKLRSFVGSLGSCSPCLRDLLLRKLYGGLTPCKTLEQVTTLAQSFLVGALHPVLAASRRNHLDSAWRNLISFDSRILNKDFREKHQTFVPLPVDLPTQPVAVNRYIRFDGYLDSSSNS